MVRIFDVEKDRVKINENCLLIPELKDVYDFYADPVPAFCYLYYMTDPFSAYSNIPADKREPLVLKDFPGDYTTEDPPIIRALDKLNLLSATRAMKVHKTMETMVDRLYSFFETATITDGRDGNIGEIRQNLRDASKILKSLKDVELIRNEELKALRGRAQQGEY